MTDDEPIDAIRQARNIAEATVVENRRTIAFLQADCMNVARRAAQVEAELAAACAILQRVADHFRDTDAPLGKDAAAALIASSRTLDRNQRNAEATEQEQP